MRSLNLLSGRAGAKDQWQRHQQVQLDKNIRYNKPLRALFPGSRLFNQILVTSAGATSEIKTALSPESLSVVYEYCGSAHHSIALNDAVVVDTGNDNSTECIDAIVSLLARETDIQKVVFLGNSAYRLFADAVSGRCTQKIHMVCIEPDWNSEYALHAIYRQARHVVFVDIMRVLDAAYTQCTCSLITSTAFRNDLAFTLLQLQLANTQCQSYDERGEGLQFSSASVVVPFLIAANRCSDLERVLLAESSDGLSQGDWLSFVVEKNSTPVISQYKTPLNKTLTNLRDYRTSVSRKWLKLRQDPGAFLADSKHPVLNASARLLSSKTREY